MTWNDYFTEFDEFVEANKNTLTVLLVVFVIASFACLITGAVGIHYSNDTLPWCWPTLIAGICGTASIVVFSAMDCLCCLFGAKDSSCIREYLLPY
jgi:hypothetical protein